MSRFLRYARNALILLVIAGIGGIAAFALLIRHYDRDLPDVNVLRDYRPPQTTRVLDRNGQLIGEVFLERRTVIPLQEIPRAVVLSTLAAEDANFFVHEGLDYRGIARAIVRDIIARRLEQGASTITQQVVKLMLLSSERTFARKMRELILTRRLEQELSKEEILHLYLNHINYGDGHYGIQEAARYYFRKDAKDLSLAEATALAGIPQGPTRLNPYRNAEASRRRQLFVLGQLESKREVYWPDVTVEAIAAARDTVLTFERPEVEQGAAPEVMRLARQALKQYVGADAVSQGGFTVHTTIDLDLQRKAREELRRGLEALDERRDFRPQVPSGRRRPAEIPPVAELRAGRTYEAIVTAIDDEASRIELDVGGHKATMRLSAASRYNRARVVTQRGQPRVRGEAQSASRFAPVGSRMHVSVDVVDSDNRPAVVRPELGPQAAAIVLDVRSRDVLALVGGYESSNGFDRATQAVRQPGSTFKPFVYADALRKRLVTAASLMDQTPVVRPGMRVPARAQELPPVRLRQALALSLNPVAIRLIEQVGPESVAGLAKAFGISTPLDPVPSLALGASDVRPIELVNGYASIAAGGMYVPYRVITRIVGPGGREITLPAPAQPERVLEADEAFVITSLMQSVVDEGTATAAKALRRPLAGKTGTTNDVRDAWFAGFSPTIAAGVWVGFDDRRPLGPRESGASAALPIWIELMRHASEGTPALPFATPLGIETALIDRTSGLLAPQGAVNVLQEVFLAGTVPTTYASDPDALVPEVGSVEDFIEEAPPLLGDEKIPVETAVPTEPEPDELPPL